MTGPPRNHVRSSVIFGCHCTYNPTLVPRGMWRPTYQTSRPFHSHVHETEFKHESADDDGSETDGSLFGWEEEATLLSDLLEEE